MRILNPDIDLERFFHGVSSSPNSVLLLDYDGTLAPFNSERDRAFPYPGVTEVLESILRCSRCRLVLITGRDIKDLSQVFRLEHTPEVWGCHGWERLMPDGQYTCPKLQPIHAAGLEETIAWADVRGLGQYCERKSASIAIHWRGLDAGSISSIMAEAESGWGEISGRTGLELHRFDGGLELRAPGTDKGIAVDAILGESGGKVPAAYLGDDRTDEDAFRAIHSKGIGILVAVESRETSADIWLTPPDELLNFLNRWYHACGGQRE